MTLTLAVNRSLRSAVLLLATLTASACEVEWAGAEFALIDPAPVPVVETDSIEAPTAVDLPLPTGPFLYAVRSATDGSAWATPIARITGEGLDTLTLPGSFDDAYRDRLDALTLPAGRELALMADGMRIGTLVLTANRRSVHAACPSAASGRVLISPGDSVPPWAFAVLLSTDPGSADHPIARRSVTLDNRMRTFGPILTENLFQAAGESRAYLAQRAVLEPLAFPDSAPGMVGTYLINDQIGDDGFSGPAASLFFVARYEPSKGYESMWSEVRRYGGDGDSREIFVYRGATSGPLGRIDFAERLGGQAPLLVASIEGTDGRREIDWMEAARCSSTDILDSVVPAVGRVESPGPTPGAP